MKTFTIVDHLKQSGFDIVEFADNPEAISDIPEQYLPAIYILPVEAVGQANDQDAGIHQAINHQYTFMVIAAPPNSQTHSEPLANALDLLRTALLGFQIDESYTEMQFLNGKFWDLSTRQHKWIETFSTAKNYWSNQ